MNFSKEFLKMSKSELILYLILVLQGEDGIRSLDINEYSNYGFKTTTFYDSRQRLENKGILRRINRSTFYFTSIKQ